MDLEEELNGEEFLELYFLIHSDHLADDSDGFFLKDFFVAIIDGEEVP